MDAEQYLYQLTLTADSNGRGQVTRELTIELRPDLLQPGTTLTVICGQRRFRVHEDVPSDLNDGMFGKRQTA